MGSIVENTPNLKRKQALKLNKKLNHWGKVREYRAIADELSIENGGLAPSMKLAKNHMMEVHVEEIEEMYAGHM